MRSGTGSAQGAARTVGLDKPCGMCGKPVYYNYKSPVEGLCGRCADRARRQRKPRVRKVRRPGGSRRGGARGWIAVAVTVAVGAVLAWLLGPFLGL